MTLSPQAQIAALNSMILDLTEERDHYKRELGISRRLDQEARVGSMLGLTPKEAVLLMVLYACQNRILTKEALLTAVYDERDEPNIKIIDVFVCKIRGKIGYSAIDTLWGRGYQLSPSGVAAVEKALRVGQC